MIFFKCLQHKTTFHFTLNQYIKSFYNILTMALNYWFLSYEALGGGVGESSAFHVSDTSWDQQ